MNEFSPAPAVTLRDIAKKLGVSHSTVSRALQNASNISPARRKEIQETAQALGYHPNAIATVLGHQRHTSHKHAIGSEIAWLNYWGDPQDLRRHREFEFYWRGASARAEDNGYRLEEFMCGHEISPSRLEKILVARNIRGVLIPPHGKFAGQLPAEWNKINWDRFAIVRFGYSVASPAAHLVTSNHLTSAMLATENMWRLGYRRIGFLASSEAHLNFRAGFLLKQVIQVKEQPAIFSFPSSKNPREMLPSLSKWLKKCRLDAILTDMEEARAMLEELGYRVPDDIGLAATSILDGNADAGIDQNSEEIGKAAFEMLLSLLKHNQYGIPKVVRETLITGSWVDGTTLPPLARGPVHPESADAVLPVA